MKLFLYAGLVVVIAPIQATLLHYVSFFGVRPDLGLVAACLVGFLGGELDGLLLGLLLGYSQDMFSAGDLWVNVVTKGAQGFLAGLAGRHMAHLTPAVLAVGLAVLSCLSSAVFLSSLAPSSPEELWIGVRSTIVLQAAFDAGIGVLLYLLFRQQWSDDRMVTDGAL